MNDTFETEVPWHIDEDTEIGLKLCDQGLVGSPSHFIRFDLYPSSHPSHPERHHGYWDVPLSLVNSERVRFFFKDDVLHTAGSESPLRIAATWAGDIPRTGYCTMTVSLWDTSQDPSRQVSVKSSEHILNATDPELTIERVQIPVTEQCNLSCPMCSRSVAGTSPGRDIQPEVLGPILDAAPHFFCASLAGLGEPLLNKNLPGIVGELKKRMPAHGWIETITNGTLMTASAASRLIDSGVNKICFSIDAASKSLYETVRSGAKYDRTIRNVAYAVEYARCSGRRDLVLWANFVVMKANYHEIPAFTSLAGNLGLNGITFLRQVDFETGSIQLIDTPVLSLLYAEAIQVAKDFGLTIEFPQLDELNLPVCPTAKWVYVIGTGDVLSCFRSDLVKRSNAIKRFGNLRKKTLTEIWLSPKYRKFRHQARAGDYPSECNGCDFASGGLSR